jgi:phosphocarrier protein
VPKEGEVNVPGAELCCKHGISNATYYQWKSNCSGVQGYLRSRLTARIFLRSICIKREAGMPNQDITISNKLGLHARAATKLTQMAGRFSSDVFITKGAQRVNTKNIMGVMLLAAGYGAVVKIDSVGADADQALADIRALFDSKFGESE